MIKAFFWESLAGVIPCNLPGVAHACNSVSIMQILKTLSCPSVVDVNPFTETATTNLPLVFPSPLSTKFLNVKSLTESQKGLGWKGS